MAKATRYNPATNKPIPNRISIRAYGLQSKIARRTGFSAPIVNLVWKGNRRATIDQAPKFEEAFIHFGIDLNRWDFLYGVEPGESLPDYLDRKEGRA